MNSNEHLHPHATRKKFEELQEAMAELCTIKKDIKNACRLIKQEIFQLQKVCRHLNTYKELPDKPNRLPRIVCRDCGAKNLPPCLPSNILPCNNFRPPTAKFMGNQHSQNLRGK